MELKRDRAIVLRSIAFQERHRVVTALTENHGLISAMARNAIQSRRFGGSLDIFSASNWAFSEKPNADLAYLQEAQILRSYDGLRGDFGRLSLASLFNELMLKLAPQQQPAPDLFKLHSNALAVLEELPESNSDNRTLLTLLNGYFAKILQWSGSQPRLAECMQCEKSLTTIPLEATLTCLIADAGWICPDCRDDSTKHISDRRTNTGTGLALMRVSPAAIYDFHISLMQPIRQIPTAAVGSEKDHRDLYRLLEALFIFHLPGFDKEPLKSLRFLGLESSVKYRPA